MTAIELFLKALKFLDGKFTDEDQIEYTKLLRALTDYRLLTSPNEAEYAGSVIASAQKLREQLNTTAQTLSMNSGMECGVLALGKTVRQFLSDMDSIESSIRNELDLVAANSEAGIQIDESRRKLLEHWQRNGYPEHVLLGNHKLNVMSIEWEGHRMKFLGALGETVLKSV